MLTGKGRTSGRAMPNYDLNYEVPRATNSKIQAGCGCDHTAPHDKINYTTWGGWVPLGLERQSVREAKIVSPTGR